MSGEFVDWISLSPDYSITEIQVPEKWIGKSLSEIDVRRTKDVNVVGVRIGEKIQVTSDPEEELQKQNLLHRTMLRPFPNCLAHNPWPKS